MNIIKLEQPLTDNTGLVQTSLLQLLRDWEHEAMVQGATIPGIWQETYEALYHTSYVVRVRSMEVTIYRTSREGVFGRLVEDSKGDLYEEMNYKIAWNWAGCGSQPLDETKDMLRVLTARPRSCRSTAGTGSPRRSSSVGRLCPAMSSPPRRPTRFGPRRADASG